MGHKRRPGVWPSPNRGTFFPGHDGADRAAPSLSLKSLLSPPRGRLRKIVKQPSHGGNSAESDYIMTDDDNFGANRAEDMI